MTCVALVDQADMFWLIAQQGCRIRNRLWAHVGVDTTVRALEAYTFLEPAFDPLILVKYDRHFALISPL